MRPHEHVLMGVFLMTAGWMLPFTGLLLISVAGSGSPLALTSAIVLAVVIALAGLAELVVGIIGLGVRSGNT